MATGVCIYPMEGEWDEEELIFIKDFIWYYRGLQSTDRWLKTIYCKNKDVLNKVSDSIQILIEELYLDDSLDDIVYLQCKKNGPIIWKILPTDTYLSVWENHVKAK